MEASVAVPRERSNLKQWCLRHLARPQPAQEFVPQIDGLRCVAILAVLLYHIQGFVAAKAGAADSASPGWLHRLLAEGHYGVPLFFALSGYILGRPFLGQRQVSLERYFLRRLTRLEPPYVINLLLVFAAKVWLLGTGTPELIPALLASLVYCHGFVFGTHSAVNGVAWSLEVEWQFYLLAPLIFLAVSRSSSMLRHISLWIMILLGGWALGIDYSGRGWIGLSILHYFGFFSAGAWVAVFDEEKRAHRRWGVGFDLLGIAAWAGITAALLVGGKAAVSLPALTAFAVLAGVRGHCFGRVLGWWPVYCTGAMCYTIYLYHFFIVSAAGRAYAALFGWRESQEMNLLLFASFAVPLVLVVCMLPYLLIERPFMVWRPGRNHSSTA